MVLLIGHRGACGHAPENTLASLRKARQLGVDCVEFDVQLAREGVPVLLHDDTLDRTTDAAGPVADYDVRALSGVDAGVRFREAFRGEPVPTLEDAVHVLCTEGLRANVEIKAPPGRGAATAHAAGRTLMQCWPVMFPRPIVSSFSPECLSVMKEVAPDLPRALLFEEVPADWREQLAILGCEGLHCHHQAAEPCLVEAVRAEGFACRVYTVNDPARAAELAAIGVDAIVTDFPDRLFSAVGACPRRLGVGCA